MATKGNAPVEGVTLRDREKAAAEARKWTFRFQAESPIIPTRELCKLMSEGKPVVLVDVRTEEEQAVSMIPGAVPFLTLSKLHPTAIVVAYDTVGLRSGWFCRELLALGLDADRVFNSEGIVMWTFDGNGLVKPNEYGIAPREPDADVRQVHVYSSLWDIAAEGYTTLHLSEVDALWRAFRDWTDKPMKFGTCLVGSVLAYCSFWLLSSKWIHLQKVHNSFIRVLLVQAWALVCAFFWVMAFFLLRSQVFNSKEPPLNGSDWMQQFQRRATKIRVAEELAEKCDENVLKEQVEGAITKLNRWSEENEKRMGWRSESAQDVLQRLFGPRALRYAKILGDEKDE